jgi:hypothetical protein
MLVMVVVGLGLVTPVFAQGTPTLTGPLLPKDDTGSYWRCSDFKSNEDGSWTAIKPVTINGAAVDQGVPFKPGTMFAGVDLGQGLTRTCSRPKD